MSNRIEIKCDGEVISWFPDKGYGFIKTAIGNIYTHISCLKVKQDLVVGQKVTCKVGMSERGQIARDVVVHA